MNFKAKVLTSEEEAKISGGIIFEVIPLMSQEAKDHFHSSPQVYM